MKRCSVILVPAAVLLLCAFGAHARSEYPEVVRTSYALAAPPDCSLCHIGPQAESTAATPFAQALKARGVGGGDTSKLTTVLQAIANDRVDSDNDSVSDADEIKAGTNPNVGNATATTPSAPTFGCSAAPTHSAARFIWLTVCTAAAAHAARRRSTPSIRRL